MVNTVKPINRKEIRWKVPTRYFFKLNFDGASKGNSGIFGIGYVIIDHKGLVIRGVLARIPDDTNHVSEAQALLHSIRLAHSLKIKKLLIEGGFNEYNPSL
ncbi:hypothetical protein SUGI_0821030 [Cryptomeria japonica]|nr:hypothetical protein SUGI_0821030 [Cryptomeria japonica]